MISIISLILTIAVIGIVVWFILQLPMPAVFRNLIIALVTLFVLIWLLEQFGMVNGLTRLRIK